MKKKVVIIGGTAKQRYFKPDKKAEHWMINGQWCGRFGQWVTPDRCFNLHRYDLLQHYGYECANESFWSFAFPKIPIYTFDRWPSPHELRGWTSFPTLELMKMPRGKYHCGTFDWLCAFAIWRQFKEIEFHGVGLCLEAGEPISSRACLEYWCGYAEGKGIKVTMAPDCDPFHFYHLVKSNLIYGLQDTPIFEDRTKKGVPYDYKD